MISLYKTGWIMNTLNETLTARVSQFWQFQVLEKITNLQTRLNVHWGLVIIKN